MHIARLFYQSILWKSGFFLSAFILNILIARHYQAAVSGELYYLISWFALGALVLSVSLESGMVYYASKKEIEPSRLINFFLLWVIGAALLLIAAFSIFYYLWPGRINSSIFLFSIVFIAGNLLITFSGSIWYARKNFTVPSATGLVINCILIVLLFFVSPQSWLNNENYLYIYFSSFLIQGILLVLLLFIFLIKPLDLSLPSAPQTKLLFRYSLLAFSANIISFFLYRVDYWFVHKYCSAQHLGDYIQVSKIAQMFFVLPSIFAVVLLPVTASGHKQLANQAVMLLSRSLFLVYGIICLALVITGKWLFPFIYGASYRDMYIPFLLLVPGILAFSALYGLTAYYAGKNRVWVNVKGCALAFMFVFIGDIFLIPAYGIAAAAAVSSIGYITYFVYVLNVFTKEYNLPLRNFFLFKISDLKKYRP